MLFLIRPLFIPAEYTTADIHGEGELEKVITGPKPDDSINSPGRPGGGKREEGEEKRRKGRRTRMRDGPGTVQWFSMSDATG